MFQSIGVRMFAAGYFLVMQHSKDINEATRNPTQNY